VPTGFDTLDEQLDVRLAVPELISANPLADSLFELAHSLAPRVLRVIPTTALATTSLPTFLL